MARDISDLDKFDAADIASLRSAPDVDTGEAEDAYNFVEEKQRAKIARLKANNEMRTTFFSWSSKLASWMIAGNFLIFIAYVILRAFDRPVVADGVMLAWVAATVVEIIGIVAIIANNLFPRPKSFDKGNNEK